MRSVSGFTAVEICIVLAVLVLLQGLLQAVWMRPCKVCAITHSARGSATAQEIQAAIQAAALTGAISLKEGATTAYDRSTRKLTVRATHLPLPVDDIFNELRENSDFAVYRAYSRGHMLYYTFEKGVFTVYPSVVPRESGWWRFVLVSERTVLPEDLTPPRPAHST